jgi:threonine 3-dehydrogenase
VASVPQREAEAMLCSGGVSFQRVERALPDLAHGETLVRMLTATVCGSDVHTVAGRRSSPMPSVLGHEGIGEVLASRGGHTLDGSPLRPGDRIVWSVVAPCGECDRCRGDQSAKCRALRKIGHEPYRGDWPLSGTYASHLVLRSNQPVVHVPDGMSGEIAATAGCAVATVMAACEAAGDVAGREVLVSGLGMLGLLGVAVAFARGAARVRGVEPDARRRAWAAAAGAIALQPGAADQLGAGVDVALEFSGSAAAVRESISSLAIGGRAVLVGSVAPGEPVALDPERVVRGLHTITGVHNYEPRHLQQAVDFLGTADAAALPWPELLDGPVPLHELGRAFAGTPRGLRTVVAVAER